MGLELSKKPTALAVLTKQSTEPNSKRILKLSQLQLFMKKHISSHGIGYCKAIDWCSV